MPFVELVEDFEGLTKWLQASLAALEAHSSGLGALVPSWYLRHGADARGAQVQIWWRTQGSRLASEMLWDYADVPSLNIGLKKFLDAALVLEAHDADVKPGATVIRPRDLASVPMFEFHPQRYRGLYPAAKLVAQAGMKSSGRGFTQDVMDVAAQAYMSSQQQLFSRTRIRRSVASKGRSDMDMIQLSMFYADFHHGGKQIFDFPKEMSEMFMRTDVDGIPLEAINLPYSSMYLHFGRQDQLEVEDGWAPDGAYVAMIGDAENKVLQFCLTFAPLDPRSYEFFTETPEPCYIQTMNAEQMKIGVGEAVDAVVAERIARLKNEVAHGSSEVRNVLEDMALELQDDDLLHATDSTHRFAAEELEKLPGRHRSWVAMLRLVVNGLAYLSAYPGDWAEQIGGGGSTPPPWAITSEIDSGNHKRAQKAKSRLAELGYTAIHFCGVRLRNIGFGSTPRQSGVGDKGSAEAWTWVRGHWRRQAHGPQWSLHRLRWQMPYKRTIDSSEDLEVAGRGHVYIVS